MKLRSKALFSRARPQHSGMWQRYAPLPDSLPVVSTMIGPWLVRTIRTSFAFGILAPQATQLRSGTCRLFGKASPPKIAHRLPGGVPHQGRIKAIVGGFSGKGLAASASSSSATAGPTTGAAPGSTAAPPAPATTAATSELIDDVLSEPNLSCVRNQDW